jgi:hypothetical protein
MKDDSVLSITYADLQTLMVAYENRHKLVLLGGGAVGFPAQAVVDFTIGAAPYRLLGDAADAFWAMRIGEDQSQHRSEKPTLRMRKIT